MGLLIWVTLREPTKIDQKPRRAFHNSTFKVLPDTLSLMAEEATHAQVPKKVSSERTGQATSPKDQPLQQ